jgi:hypothetical protein
MLILSYFPEIDCSDELREGVGQALRDVVAVGHYVSLIILELIQLLDPSCRCLH